MHEFLFVAFLGLMLFAAISYPSTFSPLDDDIFDPEPLPPPPSLPGWLAWIAPIWPGSDRFQKKPV